VNIPPEVGRQIQALARAKARHAASRNQITADEIDDLASDLVLQVIRKWPKYDAMRAEPMGYILIVIASHAAARLRRRRRQSSSQPSVESLDSGHDQARVPVGGPSETCSDPEAALYSDEFRAVLDGLPDHLRLLADAIQRSGSVDMAACLLGIHRATAYRRLRDLRAVFRKSGATP